jgi:hypothetical protein
MANHNNQPNAAYQLDATTNTFTLRAKQVGGQQHVWLCKIVKGSPSAHDLP